MLKHLHISNYALISSLDIDFYAGLNIITGETGAGKSIMLGALSLLFGARADAKTLNNDTRKAIVEAEFTNPPQILRPIFEENGMVWNSESCIIRREIAANGRSRSFVNDTPANLGILKEIAPLLVEIHSQNQNRLLAKADFQRDIIDSLAANTPLLDEYALKYNKLRSALKDLKATRQQLKDSADNAEFIRFQLSRLEKVNPLPNEEEELEQRHESLADNIKTKTLLLQADTLLNADNGIIPSLSRLENLADDLSSEIPENIHERLRYVAAELSDIKADFSALNESLTVFPDELVAIENRLEEISDLKKHFKVDTASQLEALQKQLSASLDNLLNAPAIIAQKEQTARMALNDARAIATDISRRRKEAAQKFALDLQLLAKPLGMDNLQCVINVTPTDINASGIDKVEFLFAFNKNQKPVPVEESASGGEVSRLMLCIRSLIAKSLELPTMLFDEIDTGVSGKVAVRMGEIMLQSAEHFQTIVITHLPQIASKGEHHFKVYKTDDETATHTHIAELTPQQRIDELTVMLGGDPGLEAARRNAEELLKK